MNTQKLINSVGLLVSAGLLHNVSAQTLISDGHVDIGIAYEEGAWDLHLHVGLEPDDFELEPDEGAFFGSVANNSIFQLTVPNDPDFSFLGNVGDPFWRFPISNEPGLPFIGIAAEEVEPSDFVGNLTLTFTSLSGPGDFFLYEFDTFGDPVVLFDSSDGFGDTLTLPIGTHSHYNFAFTAEGVYGVGLEASGILDDGFNTPTSSGTSIYTFGVNVNPIPEPETYALWAGAFAMGFLVLRRKFKKS